MPERAYNVLFLCTGNSARSLMAESLLQRYGSRRFRAFSAGSHPRPAPHPLALEVLRQRGHDVTALRSKSWDEFAGPDAPPLDFVFTLCDDARGEACPVWPGQPMTAHWGMEDPAAYEGSEGLRLGVFRRTYRELENRIQILTSLRIESLDRLSLQGRLEAIGKTSLPPEEG
jgi:arsenate reductase